VGPRASRITKPPDAQESRERKLLEALQRTLDVLGSLLSGPADVAAGDSETHAEGASNEGGDVPESQPAADSQEGEMTEAADVESEGVVSQETDASGDEEMTSAGEYSQQGSGGEGSGASGEAADVPVTEATDTDPLAPASGSEAEPQAPEGNSGLEPQPGGGSCCSGGEPDEPIPPVPGSCGEDPWRSALPVVLLHVLDEVFDRAGGHHHKGAVSRPAEEAGLSASRAVRPGKAISDHRALMGPLSPARTSKQNQASPRHESGRAAGAPHRPPFEKGGAAGVTRPFKTAPIPQTPRDLKPRETPGSKKGNSVLRGSVRSGKSPATDGGDARKDAGRNGTAVPPKKPMQRIQQGSRKSIGR
jgi:hypothetical protein